MRLSGSFAPQVTKTPGKDHKKPKEMEKPVPTSQPSPAHPQPLDTHFIPVVAHSGGHQPDAFKFVFYKPGWSNSYNPFYTAQKPTCGYRYNRDTDHTKKKIDVPSANVAKWRPLQPPNPQLRAIKPKQ